MTALEDKKIKVTIMDASRPDSGRSGRNWRQGSQVGGVTWVDGYRIEVILY